MNGHTRDVGDAAMKLSDGCYVEELQSMTTLVSWRERSTLLNTITATVGQHTSSVVIIVGNTCRSYGLVCRADV